MGFNIELLKNAPQFEDGGQHASWGVITLGDFEERFLAYTDCWSVSDYEAAWLEAVDLIIAGSPKSALVTDAHRRGTRGATIVWPMWRKDDTVFVQNRLLLPERIPNPLTLRNIISGLGERQTLNDEGEPLSEWHISVSELRTFRDRIRGTKEGVIW